MFHRAIVDRSTRNIVDGTSDQRRVHSFLWESTAFMGINTRKFSFDAGRYPDDSLDNKRNTSLAPPLVVFWGITWPGESISSVLGRVYMNWDTFSGDLVNRCSSLGGRGAIYYTYIISRKHGATCACLSPIIPTIITGLLFPICIMSISRSSRRWMARQVKCLHQDIRAIGR